MGPVPLVELTGAEPAHAGVDRHSADRAAQCQGRRTAAELTGAGAELHLTLRARPRAQQEPLAQAHQQMRAL